MNIEFIVNGGVSLLLSPENAMEEELLKSLMKQNVELTEIRSTVHILGKTFRNGVLLGKRTIGVKKEEKPGSENEAEDSLNPNPPSPDDQKN